MRIPVCSLPAAGARDGKDGSGTGVTAPRRIKLLSYNIQAGIATNGYRHYLTHSWKHVLPCPKRLDNLDRIAKLIGEFDIVGLQEVDGGSLRSGFINQTEYLALSARFPYWYDQTNRNLGKFAQHSTGILSRLCPAEVTEVKLPGMIPGRGALTVRFGHGADALILVIAHLALGRRARFRQLECIADIIGNYRHVIVMGDMNCGTNSREIGWLVKHSGLREPAHTFPTFPSWRPSRNLDQILVSSSLKIERIDALNYPFSDHLPIVMEVALPMDLAWFTDKSVAAPALTLASAAA
ncbi:MAG: endonuclease/exonuclease/phosphatase family protein [Gammaproteobacteria bacterium]|nr:endonuclease/exonuclease/phosphatase family protein [Gammaproteobacteria bacterium]MDH5512717.1 endonuclease/exonuclease/phosphatase family protein [Gammaproteobacteria bacterium]